MTTLEKAAEAVFEEARRHDLTYDYGHDNGAYRAIVRAALMAVREPPRLAVNAAIKAGHEATGLDDILHFPTAFSAAIDAILNDGEGE